MNAHQVLSSLTADGVEVTCYAVEQASASNNQNNNHNHNEVNIRAVDDFFTVELSYRDIRNFDDIRHSNFTLKKEIERWEILTVAMNELEALEVDAHAAYDCVIDVLSESCEVLLQEVVEFGRKSLAMIVNIEVDQELARVIDDDDDGMYYSSEYDMDDRMEVEEEEEVVMVNSMEVKEFLSSNGGARFIRGDQVKTDDIGCCSICLEEFDKPEKNIDVAVLCCSHVLHSDCLVPWIVKGKYTCPMCRSNLIPH